MNEAKITELTVQKTKIITKMKKNDDKRKKISKQNKTLENKMFKIDDKINKLKNETTPEFVEQTQ